jgi:hypothetical protein
MILLRALCAERLQLLIIYELRTDSIGGAMNMNF